MTIEPDDLARLYETHAVDLLRFVARRTLQADVAMDLVAETFAQAFAHRGQFRGDGEQEALAWVYPEIARALGISEASARQPSVTRTL
jgi:DNA-directed RNA polymerase specialized sigma24 family protein